MTERKVFNFESKILIEDTISEFGYNPDIFGKTSSKFVIATCRFCGEKMPIRKGFFNKSGSACHRKCLIEEMKVQKSPFSDPQIREKAIDRIKEIYGEDRKEIREKISKSKKESTKYKETCLEKYGVENTFQLQSVKDKIKKTNIEKYGVASPLQNIDIKEKTRLTNISTYGVENPMQNKEIKLKVEKNYLDKHGVKNPMQNEEIKEKTRLTNIERYGVGSPIQNKDIFNSMKETNRKKYGVDYVLEDQEIINKIKSIIFEKYGVNNVFSDQCIKDKIKETFVKKYNVEFPSQNPVIKKKIMDSFQESVFENKNNKFDLVNILRNNNDFWNDLSTDTLFNMSVKYNLDYNSLRTRLCDDEFRERYHSTYSYPKNQTQKIIYNIVSDLGFTCEMNTRQIISPYELDIYIPEKKFAIEFNGDYWHSEAVIDHNEARNKHINKMRLCRKQGIYLFQIFEHQWDKRSVQILNFIKTILGANKINIPARKCVLSNKNANDFLNNNHIQGNTNSVLKYFTLEYDGEIVASMTASRHHRQNVDQNVIVLSRLCFKDGFNVQGGSSKLFKYFIEWAKNEGYSAIISWSDNCWTEGNIYNVLGFKLTEEYGPDYFYYNIKTHTVHSKQSKKKSVTGCPKEIMEHVWNAQNGFYRVFDCGKKKWILEL